MNTEIHFYLKPKGLSIYGFLETKTNYLEFRWPTSVSEASFTSLEHFSRPNPNGTNKFTTIRIFHKCKKNYRNTSTAKDNETWITLSELSTTVANKLNRMRNGRSVERARISRAGWASKKGCGRRQRWKSTGVLILTICRSYIVSV